MAQAKKSSKSAKPRSSGRSTTKKPPITDLAAAEPVPQPVGDSDDAFVDLGGGRSHRWAWITLACLVLVAVLLAGFQVVYAGKIYPGVSMNGVYLGGLDKSQAKTTLAQAEANYAGAQVPIQYGNTTLAVGIKQIDTTYDLDTEVAAAYQHGRDSDLADRLRQAVRSIVGRPTLLSQFSYDDAKLQPFLNQIADQVDTPVANAALTFSDTGRVEVNAQHAGQRLDLGLMVMRLEQQIAKGTSDFIQAPIYPLDPSVTSNALDQIKTQANTYVQGPLTLTLSGTGKTSTVQIPDIVKWVKVNQAPELLPSTELTLASFAPTPPVQPLSLSLDNDAITAYVAGLAKTVDRSSQNAALTIDNNVATVFQPSQTGYQLDQAGAVTSIEAGLTKPAADRQLTLAVKTIQPDVNEANLNSLGINELISEGVTYFPGSPAARMQNIRVGASKFNGVLVAPDSTFSFESLLGNVDAAAGYAPALVILGNKEVYQYGGGMCQVSSTAFRAALLAGLPIVERHNHSFAVGYYTAPYGVPGVDATVFDLSVDFKFKNDTGHYILIQTQLSGTTLKFDFYGTKTKSGQIRGPFFSSPAGGAGWNATVPSTTYFYRDVLDTSGNVTKTDTFTEHYASSLDFPVSKELN